MVITHKSLYLSTDITKGGVFIRVNTGFPFNVSDGQVSQYKGVYISKSLRNVIRPVLIIILFYMFFRKKLDLS